MQITYVTNYINHHTYFLADAFYHILGDNFTYIETHAINDASDAFRQGYAFYFAKQLEKKNLPWVLPAYASGTKAREAQATILESDATIIANTSDAWVKERLAQNKLTFRAHERWYKNAPLPWYRLPRAWAGGWIHHRKFPSLYLLCASAYAAYDANRVGCFRGKTYKWGYFPETKFYTTDELVNRKQHDITTILWAGRMIEGKRPMDAINAVKKLKDLGYAYILYMAGDGPLLESMRSLVDHYGLQNNVVFLGTLQPDDLREQMADTNIFLLTSNREEGWGVTLNEAMNAGCAVIANHNAGATPYLVNDGMNGLIFRNQDVIDLTRKLVYLIQNPLLQKRFGLAAYHQIIDSWSPAAAAANFITLCEQMLLGNTSGLPGDVICSIAKPLRDDWYDSCNH